MSLASFTSRSTGSVIRSRRRWIRGTSRIWRLYVHRKMALAVRRLALERHAGARHADARSISPTSCFASATSALDEAGSLSERAAALERIVDEALDLPGIPDARRSRAVSFACLFASPPFSLDPAGPRA